MKRELVARILDGASGIEKQGSEYRVGEDHQLTFYIGEPGRAMAISEVSEAKLDEDLIQLRTRETGTYAWLEYEVLHAVTLKPPREHETRRAGFA